MVIGSENDRFSLGQSWKQKTPYRSSSQNVFQAVLVSSRMAVWQCTSGGTIEVRQGAAVRIRSNVLACVGWSPREKFNQATFIPAIMRVFSCGTSNRNQYASSRGPFRHPVVRRCIFASYSLSKRQHKGSDHTDRRRPIVRGVFPCLSWVPKFQHRE